VIAALAVAAPAQAAALPDPLAEPAAFQDPPRDVRPGFRWWWGGDAVSQTPFDVTAGVKEVEAMAKAGFGRFEIAWSASNYGQQGQRDHLRQVLDAARRNDIGLEMTLGTNWPWNTPANTGDYATLELLYGRKDVTGPGKVSEQAPAALDGSREGKLVAVTAARVIARGPAASVNEPPPSSTVLDPASLIDLTANTAPDGTVTWDVPSGDWILFSFWQRAGENAVNPMDKESTRVGLEWVGANQVGDVGKDLPGIGGSFFEDSLEYNADELYWAASMPAEFRARRGYEMTKYLPLMFVQTVSDYWVPQDEPVPDFDLPDGEGARYRHDYYETITDLYIEDHIVPIQKWAEQYGMKFRSQTAYGNPFEVIRSARGIVRAGGLAEDESLNAGDSQFAVGTLPNREPGYLERMDPYGRFAMDHYRQIASGSHQAGGTEIGSELGAYFMQDLRIGATDLRQAMDKEWAFGITRPLLHGYTNSPDEYLWPGRSHFNGLVGHTFNHRTYPQWQQLPALADYWARGTLVLQQGKARTDMAILRDNFVTTQAGPEEAQKLFFDAAELEDAGYTVGYVDPVGVTEQAPGRRGALFPDGPRYGVLVIDSTLNYVGPGRIPAATAEAIDRASQRGLRVVVVGDAPSRGTNGADPAGEDARVQAAMSAILARSRTRVVARQSEVADAVRELRLRPAAEWDSPQPVFSQRRDRGGTSYFYLWNASPKALSFAASFAARGLPRRLDLWTGEQEAVFGSRTSRRRIRVPIELAPRETLVLAFARPAGDVTVERLRAAGDEPLAIDKWELAVESWGPEGTTPLPAITLDELTDWRDLPQLRGVSGIGTYTATVKVPEQWVASGRGVRLDLGRVEHSTVQTFVNGRLANADVNGYGRPDVSELLRAGDNEIKVVLATTLYHRARVTPTFAASRPLSATELAVGEIATGLLGPVRLLPATRERITITPPG
jgi:hypothetical protein